MAATSNQLTEGRLAERRSDPTRLLYPAELLARGDGFMQAVDLHQKLTR